MIYVTDYVLRYISELLNLNWFIIAKSGHGINNLVAYYYEY